MVIGPRVNAWSPILCLTFSWHRKLQEPLDSWNKNFLSHQEVGPGPPPVWVAQVVESNFIGYHFYFSRTHQKIMWFGCRVICSYIISKLVSLSTTSLVNKLTKVPNKLITIEASTHIFFNTEDTFLCGQRVHCFSQTVSPSKVSSDGWLCTPCDLICPL